MGFFKSIIKELIENGNSVDIATNETNSNVPDYYREWGCSIFHISTSRSPFSFGNIRAIKQIRTLAKSYDLVHCHTPLAGMATRLGCRKLRKNGLKVVYTAHGFHFFKGSPRKNWLIYYPIEKLCSRWTDVLITITKEDYELAKCKMKARRIEYVPGVGIDVNRIRDMTVNKKEKREKLGIPLTAKMILSVGELNVNKNHQFVIEALSKIRDENIFYVVAGDGEQKNALKRMAEESNVNLLLLGYRTDVLELCKVSDLFILPSRREGLNVSVMEAMAAGCPVIASRIRGNVDMVPLDNCFNLDDIDSLIRLINKRTIINSDFTKNVDFRNINNRIISIYEECLRGELK